MRLLGPLPVFTFSSLFNIKIIFYMYARYMVNMCMYLNVCNIDVAPSSVCARSSVGIWVRVQ